MEFDDSNVIENPNPELGETETQEQTDTPLAEDSQQQESGLEQRERELNKREFLFNARQRVISEGLPDELLDALNTSNQEAFDKSLAIINDLFKHRPSMKNPDTEALRIKWSNRDEYLYGGLRDYEVIQKVPKPNEPDVSDLIRASMDLPCADENLKNLILRRK